MPNISLLEPIVLRGVVEKFVVPESLLLLSTIPQTPYPDSTVVTWDIIKGARQVAKPNVPNSEAQIVSLLGRSQATATMAYYRLKKVFGATTIRWLREPGQLAATNAEKAVLREVQDLNNLLDNAAEQMLWGALSGSLSLTMPTGATQNINYQFPSSHIVSTPASGTAVQADWASANPVEIVEDLRNMKLLVSTHGRVPAKQAFAHSLTLALIFDSFTAHGISAGAAQYSYGSLLSDRMKDEYYSTGVLNGFMGMNWVANDTVYEDNAGNLQYFVNPGYLYLGNYTDQRPVELMIGPAADDDAPPNYTGKFAKTFKEFDPSQRQYLIEWNLIPTIERPEQMVYANVSPTLNSSFLPIG